jgi:hypothetical protein
MKSVVAPRNAHVTKQKGQKRIDIEVMFWELEERLNRKITFFHFI